MGSLKANLIQRMEYMCCTEALVIFVYLKHHTYIDPNHPLTSDMEIKTKYTKINFSRLLRLVVLPLPHLHDSQWSGQGALYISYLFIWSHVQLITFYRSLGASTCYSAVSCHVSQSSCWGRRPERGIFREKSNSNAINMSHIPWGQKSWEGWAHIIYSWTWIGTISWGTPWGTLHPLSVALAVFRFVQVKLENGSHVLCA